MKERKKKKIKEHKERIKNKENLKFNKYYIGEKWVLYNFHQFYFKYNIRMLDSYNIGFPYVNC